LQSAFRRFDQDGNGWIEKQELHNVMSQVGHEPSQEDISRILASLDVNNDKRIEWAEFASLMADRWLRQDGDTDMHMALSLLDGNVVAGESDIMDVNKLKDLLCKNGESPLSKSEWDSLMQLADPQKTGRISLQDFRELPCWRVPPMELDTHISTRADSSAGGSVSSGLG